MSRKALARPVDAESGGQGRISRDCGEARFIEGMMLLAVVAVLAIGLGLVLGVPLAMMLHDICTNLAC